MTSSKVYFVSAQAERHSPRGMLHRMDPLFEAVGAGFIEPGDLVAVKLSFSEWGNTACLRPQFVRQVVDGVKRAGGKPFLTDANTLYSGGRSNAVDHINTAIKNGFGYDAIGAPIIIADGLTGRSSKRVATGTEHVKEPRIGAEVFHSDTLISLAHIHGHMGTGFAGTFKNVGMGLGCRAGKQEMHSQEEPPSCDGKKCVLCGDCVQDCPVDAITLSSKNAVIDEPLCIRCGECTTICPEGAIAIRWGDEPGMMQRRMVDYTKAVLMKKKALFYAFLFDICPDCLCNDFNKPAIVPDIGILASRDPVAVEQAAFDMTSVEVDEFRKIYPEHDSEICMAYGEEIGLGSRKYSIVEI